jgi:hypothetical protein
LGGVGTLGGVGVRGAFCALSRRASGVSSSSSSSSVKPATTLRHFRLLSSSLIIKGPPCLGVSGLPLLGRPICLRVLPRCFPHHAGFPRIHAGWPVIDEHVGDVHSYPVLAMNLASIKLSVTVVDQQLSEIKLTLWVTLDIPVVAALSICTPSLRSTIGGIPISQTVAPTTSSPPHA